MPTSPESSSIPIPSSPRTSSKRSSQALSPNPEQPPIKSSSFPRLAGSNSSESSVVAVLPSPSYQSPIQEMTWSASSTSVNGTTDDAPLTREEELDLLAQGMRNPQSLDTDYVLVGTTWNRKWKNHLLQNSEPPGPIDNTTLFTDTTLNQLKPSLFFPLDFLLVPDTQFTRLVAKYDILQPKHKVKRRGIVRNNSPIYEIEMYLQVVQVVYLNPPSDQLQQSPSITLQDISQTITVAELKLKICAAFDLKISYPEQASRLWLMHYGAKNTVLDDSKKLYEVMHQNVQSAFHVGLETRETTLKPWPDVDRDVIMVDSSLNGPIQNRHEKSTYNSSSLLFENTGNDIDSADRTPVKGSIAEKRDRARRIQNGELEFEPKATTKVLGLVEYSPHDSPSTTAQDLGLTVTPTAPPLPSASTTTTPTASRFSSNNYSSFNRSRADFPVGATGLNNLGNTCYMNSALQCLSNVTPLTLYFATGRWERELNRDNPLGKGGEVAEAYADVISHVWQAAEPRSNSFAPRDFKGAIGKASTQFVGYQQQDSQELLGFLLDGLHEDLNRIIKKPYTELPDYNGEPDEEVATSSWKLYLMRNDSIIVDLFQGQYKSRVECTECQQWSIKFDPYMFLSVPIPDRREITLSVIVLPKALRDRSKADMAPVKIQITAPKDANIQTLKRKVSDRMLLSPYNMTVIEIHSSKIWKVFADDERLDTILASDLIYVAEGGDPDWDLYEVPEHERNVGNVVNIPVYLTEVSDPTQYSSSNGSSRGSNYVPRYSSKIFGVPVMVSLPGKIYISPPVTHTPLTEKEMIAYYSKTMGERIYLDVVRSLRRYAVAPLFKRAISRPRLDQVVVVERGDVDDAMVPAIATPASLMSTDEDGQVNGTSERMEYTMDSDETLLSKSTDGILPSNSTSHQPQQPQPTYEYGQTDIDDGWLPISNLFKLHLATSPVKTTTASSSYGYGGTNTDSLLDKYNTFLRNEYNDKDKFPLYPFKPTPPANGKSRETELNGDVEPKKSSDDDDDYKTDAFPIDQTKPYIVEFDPMKLHHAFMTEWLTSKANAFLRKNDKAFEVTLHPDFPKSYNKTIEVSNHGKPIRLEDCLREFMKEEVMGEEDTWYCPKCKKHQRIKKKLDIWSAPEVLVFHLKRFSSGRGYSWRSMGGDKIDCLVDFPKTGLDITDFVIGRESSNRRRPPRRRPAQAEEEKTATATSMEIEPIPSVSEPVVDVPISDWPVVDAEPKLGSGVDHKLTSGEDAASKPSRPNNEDLWFDEEMWDENMAIDNDGNNKEGDERLIYDLCGVSNHFGGMGGGHYTAYAKNSIDGQWYNFDDSSVSKANEDNVVSSAAYLLFYQRRRNGDRTADHLSQLVTRQKTQPPPSEPKTFSAFNSWSSSGGFRLGGATSSLKGSLPFSSIGPSLPPLTTDNNNTAANTPARPSSPVESGADPIDVLPSFNDAVDKGKGAATSYDSGVDQSPTTSSTGADIGDNIEPLLGSGAEDDELPGYEPVEVKDDEDIVKSEYFGGNDASR
ncbi:hypothetical protein SmJEL517_g03085 [Synchytrium microbalum]|uniref:ubiquitinyl hydrolase 1 n=1 Tax=Synchytrium microbalum TaxID=1806994 RepID=A0A507C437_9FUNG|nr:uncharacterized protein SmJEL517_g03085 [Synchytrium microbalum]TPX34231.1 hypothetical protein SmJEL517_g03085 [Synchytrium microbalum]